ncbi:hypothetical protein HOLleu_40518 [Holothuria leucospilota]|uniref:Uncharacterized protein n=1 Tax=Holothuria leucospilota TaxID=206669 RepID=A0A9Q1BCX6_HOLLE|nr:hypothetical protein HOLleu_40518 [Holothuria leucospilota]
MVVGSAAGMRFDIMGVGAAAAGIKVDMWDGLYDTVSLDSDNLPRGQNLADKGRGLRAVSRRNQETHRLRNFNPDDLDEALSLADDMVKEKKKKQWARQANQKREARSIFSDP